MSKTTITARFLRALGLVLVTTAAGHAIATPTRGTQLNNWCALAPIQSVAPQQSRPYTAAGSSCQLCHNTTSPSLNDLNARATAVASCSGSGTATTCGASVNPYCVATAPTAASISAPPVGTSVALGQSVTFTAGGTATSPDGFPLGYTWLFSSGQAAASGSPVAVAMTVAGAVTTTLEVRNSVGMLATGAAPTRVVTVTPGTGNQPPLASIVAPAANVSVAAGGSVTFQGSGSDPDGNLPLTYAWTFTGGSPASSTAQNPGTVTYATAGTYTASLIVRDSLGLASASATRTVTVTAVGANQPPVATIVAPAANVSIAAGGSVSFQGSGSDPDGNLPLGYAWSFPGGTPASSATQNPGAVTYAAAGTYTASLTVTDSLGLASAAVTRVVTVTGTTGGNQPPVATISAPSATTVTVGQGGSVSYRGSGTDPDRNLPLSYNWTFLGGTPASASTASPAAVTYNTAGTFTTSFAVVDSLGLASVPVTRTIVVTPSSSRPVASIGSPAADVVIAPGGSVNFRGSGTSPGRRSITYSWTFPGGTPASSTAQNPGNVTFASGGVFVVTLVVTDSRGLVSATATRTITVAVPPVATITLPGTDVTIAMRGSVYFQGSGTDPGGNLPLTYRWTFAGGSPATSTAQSPGAVSYAAAGSFTASLIVTDSVGLASEPATRTITVSSAPVAVIVNPCINVSVLPGTTINFRGQGSGSANPPLTYQWTFPGGSPSRSSSQNPAVRYSTPGVYTATLIVTDARGRHSAAATRVITVAAANQGGPSLNQCNSEHENEHD